MVNYQSSTNTQQHFWVDYDGPTYSADIALAAELGFTTIRVSVPLAGGAFDDNPTRAQLGNLSDFAVRAAATGLTVRWVLFSQWGSYGYHAASQAWAGAILGVVGAHRATHSFELQNELPLQKSSASSDAYGGNGPDFANSSGTVATAALWWAQAMIPSLRDGTDAPITCSTVADQLVAGDGSVGVYPRTLQAMVGGIGSLLDWVEWHIYGPAPSLHAAVAAAEAVCGRCSLVIGEGGPAHQSGVTQSDWLQTLRYACQDIGLPEPAPWTLLDMTPHNSGGFSGRELTSGLYDTSRQLKAHGAVYKAYPLGSVIAPVPFNGKMAGSQVDAAGNRLPERWRGYYGGGSNRQPLTTAIDPSVFHTAAPSLALTGAGHTDPSVNPPAVQITPLDIRVGPGDTYTLGVWIRGDGDTGSGRGYPTLQISWFDLSGRFVANTNGAPITVRKGWTQVTLSSTAPGADSSAGTQEAAFLTLSVRVGYNAGTIWIDDATLDGQAVVPPA